MATDVSRTPWGGMGVPGATNVLMPGRWSALVKNARDAAPEPEPEAEVPETEEGESDSGSE